MPTYEYECTACGQHIEVFQRFSEDSLTVCGGCGGVLRKVFHPAGIVFKGSGFYVTDSRSTGKARSGDKADKTESAEKGKKEAGASKAEAGSSSPSSDGGSQSSDGGSKSSDASGSKATATKDPA